MVRLGCFTSFASKTKRYVIVDLKPSLFCLQTHHLLSTNTTVSPKQDHTNFTVNYLIHSCGLSPQCAISASKRVKLQSQQKADSVLVSFRNHGFSESQIAQVVRGRPQILSCHFEKTILPKIQYFTSVGLSAEDLAKIVASNPSLLHCSLENQIIPTHELLKSMLPHDYVVTVLRRNSRILIVNHDTNLSPNIKFLKELGMPPSCIAWLLSSCTYDVPVSHEKFVKVVLEAKDMGFDMKKSTSLCAIRALCNKDKMDLCRRVYMMRWGWPEEDVVSAFRRHPPCMLVSEKKLMQVMDFLVNKMEWPSRMIAKHPGVFAYSFEKRLIPRYSVFKVLLSTGLVNEDSSLLSVLVYTEKQFLEMFVAKFVGQIPQLMSVYQGTVDFHHVISSLKP